MPIQDRHPALFCISKKVIPATHLVIDLAGVRWNALHGSDINYLINSFRQWNLLILITRRRNFPARARGCVSFIIIYIIIIIIIIVCVPWLSLACYLVVPCLSLCLSLFFSCWLVSFPITNSYNRVMAVTLDVNIFHAL